MGLYDQYCVSGPKAGDPPSSGSLIAWVQNSGLFKDSNQYHVHWVYPTPRVPGMKTWEDMGHGPHEHKNPEVVIHIGTNEEDPYDLGGEVWFYLGKEQEKHVITRSTLVYLPAGFIHSPWVIKKVTKPFVMVTVMQEIDHTELSHPELLTEEENKKMMYIDQGYKSPERIITKPKGIGREW